MLKFLLDILFPQETCCLCRKPGRYSSRHPWCHDCKEKMRSLSMSSPVCKRCGKYIHVEQVLCTDCKTHPPRFEIARAVGPYEDCFRISTKVLKFMGRKQLAVKMGHMMADKVKEEPGFGYIDMVVPVPISRGSLKQRGFNQAEILARQIAKELKAPMHKHAIIRIKETPSQRELSKEDREKNLLYAFQVKHASKVKEKNVLLVDDVYTTGSTGRECTRVLMDAGAKQVGIITWATGQGF
ncbi:MAG: ComF family protein [Bacillota bacterium]|nr:ComF family protein [Bacillota bacterium]